MGVITKITEKFVFLDCGLKSEPIIDVNELRTIGLENKITIGGKIPVLLERLEDRNGEIVVSASKAQKIKGWDILVDAFEKNEPIIGKITSKCKGGVIVDVEGIQAFLPGSQIDVRPVQDFDDLLGKEL